MKRLIGYISVCISMLLAIFVITVPSLLKVNGTGEYESQRQYVYKISEKSTELSTYGQTTTEVGLNDEDKQDILDDVVDEFKTRLDNADITDYTLETSGFDTIKVTFKVDNDLYDDVSSYLNFSWSFMASDYFNQSGLGQTASDIETDSGNDNFIETGSARIEYKDNYPYVVVKLKDPDEFKTLLNTAKDYNENGESSTNSLSDYNGASLLDDDDDESDTTTTNDYNKVYILNNWLTGLDIKTLLGSGSEFLENTETKDFILFSLDTNDFESIYWDYDSTLTSAEQESEVYEEIYFGNYNASTEEGFYDATESDRVLAYKKANLWMQKFNSSTYDYKITLINVNGDYNYTETVSPLVGFIVYMKEINWSNGLLIASIIATVVIGLFLILNNGINGVSSFILTLAMFIISIGLFNLFGSEFNIGAIIGLLSLILISLFTSTIYFKKIKNEIYLGKNYKKAYQDGGKKAFYIQLDITIITLILGITSYLIQNSILISFGSLLIVGSILNLVLNIAILRPLSWLLYNSSVVTKNIKLLSIEKSQVPDLSKDEKPTYFDKFNVEQPKKTTKFVGIVGAILLIAGIAGMTTFGILRDGNIYNTTSSATSSEIVIRIDKNNAESDDSLTIDNYIDDLTDIFSTRLYKNETTLLIPDPEIISYNYSYLINDVTNKEYYFVIDLETIYSETDNLYIKNNEDQIVEVNVVEGMNLIIQNNIEVSSISLNQVYSVNNDSNNLYSLIFASIGIAIVSIYMLLRFNISRTITSIILIGGSLTITVGIFSLLNAPFVSTITLGVLFLTMFGYILLDLYFTKEKELKNEKIHDLSNLDNRRSIYQHSANELWIYIVNSSLIASFAVISLFFATGIDKYLLILILLGMIILLIACKYLSIHLEISFNKLFISIQNKYKNRPKKEKDKKDKKDNDGPEEAIFIGIND